MSQGILVGGDHSGTGNFEAAAQDALQSLGAELCPAGQPEMFCAVDKSTSARTMLLQGPCRHVFADLMEQMSELGRDIVEHHRPLAWLASGRRIECFQNMYEQLLSRMHEVPPDDREMRCARSGENVKAFVTRMSGSEYRPPIIIWLSGTECYAFSTMGKQERAAHRNFETFLVWVLVVRKNKPHLLIHEITELQPEGILEFFFADMYSIIFN